MKKMLVLGPCAALLFACSGGGTGPVTMQPGQWETTVQFANIEVPGVPEAQVAAMRSALSRPQTRPQCITQAQAANPMGNMMGQTSQGCNFTKNTFANGTIDISGTCNPPGGQATATMTMTGTYTANTITAQVTTEARPTSQMPGQPQMIRMTGTISAHRTGDCPGGAR